MAAEAEFDASLLKKKKKKKPVIDPDELDKIDDKSAAATEELGTVEAMDENLEEEFGKKKKKKKKPLLLDDDGGEETIVAEPPEDSEDGEDGELDFSKKKPKKKSKKKVDFDSEAGDEGESANTSGLPDYSYEELLERVFNIMHEKNPDMITGEKKKFVMRPPRVARVGTKKTAFVNFSEICKMLHRQAKHLLAFLLAELGTSGSVDGNNQLIIKGRFQQKHIENVLRKYIKEYVTCHTCKSADTNLQKDTRLFFLQCETCGSRCSVTSIKSGFQAITTKRARRRAAAP